MFTNNMNDVTPDYNIDLMMSIIKQVTPYIYRLADQFKIEFDDLYQECAIAILGMMRTYQPYNATTLANRVVRTTALDMVKARSAQNRKANYIAEYLYMPLAGDNEFTLADTLAADTTPRQNNPRHVKALHKACRKLPVQYQLFLKYQLGLTFAVNRKTFKGRPFDKSNLTAVNSRMMKAIRMLRADATLAVEVAR